MATAAPTFVLVHVFDGVLEFLVFCNHDRRRFHVVAVQCGQLLFQTMNHFAALLVLLLGRCVPAVFVVAVPATTIVVRQGDSSNQFTRVGNVVGKRGSLLHEIVWKNE